MPPPGPNPEVLRQRAIALRAAIREHKLWMRRHREALSVAAQDLADVEAQCRRAGIAFALPPTPQEA
jgi:hypothetical protein